MSHKLNDIAVKHLAGIMESAMKKLDDASSEGPDGPNAELTSEEATMIIRTLEHFGIKYEAPLIKKPPHPSIRK